MKSHQDVAQCNNKNINEAAILKIVTIKTKKLTLNNKKSLSKSPLQKEVTPLFLDCTARRIKTPIKADNVFVFGSNRKLNQEVAAIVEEGFADSNSEALVITISHFFAMEISERRSDDVFYIIVCNDIDISAKHLATLKKFTGTQILFKIKGVDWKISSFGVLVKEVAMPTLRALEIDETNSIKVGLLASLGNKEFLVNNGRNFTKRML